MASFSDIQLDAGIARGLKRGDEQAQTVAYRVLSPAVMGMAVRILQDHGLAQEVVQDTFVELIEHAHKLKEPSSVIGWVRRVAVNHCLMRLRSPWHQRRVTTEDDGYSEPMDPQATGDRNDDLWDLEHALAELPADTRMVLWLHDVEGYTHQEIATLAGKTASYSKSQLARGYQKLSDRYGQTQSSQVEPERSTRSKSRDQEVQSTERPGTASVAGSIDATGAHPPAR
jgi:RNA polymerase sigma factor (sigma-70 family)